MATFGDLWAAILPAARHAKVACSGHFMNGRHHRCFETAMSAAVLSVLHAPPTRVGARRRARFVAAPCLAEDAHHAEPRRRRARAS